MNFSEALELLKQGRKVTHKGWPEGHYLGITGGNLWSRDPHGGRCSPSFTSAQVTSSKWELYIDAASPVNDKPFLFVSTTDDVAYNFTPKEDITAYESIKITEFLVGDMYLSNLKLKTESEVFNRLILSKPELARHWELG